MSGVVSERVARPAAGGGYPLRAGKRVVKSSGRRDRRTELAAVPVIWSRATGRCVRVIGGPAGAGRARGAYHEESANDRSDSVSVRTRVSQVPLASGRATAARKEERNGTDGRVAPGLHGGDGGRQGRRCSECTRTRRREGPRNGSTQPNDGRFLARVTRWPSFTGGEQIKRVATPPPPAPPRPPPSRASDGGDVTCVSRRRR